MKKLKLTPATAIGAVDPISGKMIVATNGDVPTKIAPQLLEYANKLGGVRVIPRKTAYPIYEP